MNEQKTNKMADVPVKKLFWKMGLPMIISMVLQALYNVVDSIFVTNMGEKGGLANQALTIAFPIQILIIAIGVGTGVGLNALLSVMMAGMNAILGMAKADPIILVGSFGIYYKIQQIALFSAFGLSNTIISILSFNYGMRDRKRIDECIKFGIIDTFIVTLVLTIVFEVFAKPLASLFGLTGGTTIEIIDTCAISLRIASIGYIFMGISVAIQGVLQSIGYALKPLIISLCRLVIFVFPVAYIFTLSDSVTKNVWWTFPIAEILTAFISILILKKAYKDKIVVLENVED